MEEPTLGELFLSEKVGSFTLRRSYQNRYSSYAERIDEIIDVEVTKETRLSTDQNIQQVIAKFEDFDFGSQAEAAAGQPIRPPPKLDDKVSAMVLNAFHAASKPAVKQRPQVPLFQQS